ncbi:MAG: B12-binding domain-containing radical SAM protein [Armatimonadota bacterium]
MPGALLISYGGYPYTPSSLTPDNGLANLAGALVEEGWEARILDFGTVSSMRRLFPRELTERLRPEAERLLGGGGPLDDEARARLHELDAVLQQHQGEQTRAIAEEVTEEVRDSRPDFVGMKLWNGDGFTGSVVIAERLREEFPKLPIYGGGPQSSWWGARIFRRTHAFTCLLDGEGERAIKLLAEHALGRSRLDGIPGVTYREGGRVRVVPRAEGLEMDDLPEPIYDETLYPAMVGDEKIKIIVIDDSRGCPHQCAFCTHPVESGRRLRTASPDLLVDRMQQIVQRHGITAFRFSGSSTPGDLMAKVADEILERDLDVSFTCFGHFASASPDHFQRVADAGLYAMFFGIESGCPDVLERAVGKKIKLDRVKDTVRQAQDAGIFVVTSMIVPLPFDTEETIQQSLELLLDLRPDSVPVQFPGILPGTPWWINAEQYGLEFDPVELAEVELDYKIKLLFPPSMWEPVPYRVNGMDFRQFTRLTTQFSMALEEAGILTAVPDDNALIAHCAGMAPRRFRDLARLWCAVGDAEAMGEMVATANRNIQRGGL